MMLEELGFFSDDDIHFFPVSSGKKRENDMYAIIEDVNRNYEDIIDIGFADFKA